MQRPATAFAALIVLSTSFTPAHAQPRQFGNWKETAPLRAPKGACRDLRALTNYNLSIDVATVIPARDNTPEFCQVQGQILPEIRFEVALPARWNGRLYMTGNGGYAGNLGSAVWRDRGLAAGFAVTRTDTGHDAAREPLATFALNPQKLIDYAYRAIHVTAVTAKDVARAYYGAAVDRAYFDGCSTGGRQGLISAQRFPADFDGIIVGAPVLDFTGTMMQFAQIHQAVSRAPRLIDKVAHVAKRIYDKCDAIDGLSDGIIDDPRQCAFEPATDAPSCGSGQVTNECLTPEEVAAFKAVYGPVTAGGATLYPGLPVGAEAAAPTPGGNVSGWQGWIVSPKPPTLAERFVETFFKYMVTPGTEIDWRSFDPGRDAAKLQGIAALLNATDPDLRPFRARGGKILMYFGWADPALNPVRAIQYFEEVRRTTGSTDDFFRLFMMPGVFHCSAGPGPDAVDTMTPLVAWVERGVAPSHVIAAKGNPAVTRSRPLCPYPQVAVYKGSGSTDDAANFACSAKR